MKTAKRAALVAALTLSVLVARDAAAIRIAPRVRSRPPTTPPVLGTKAIDYAALPEGVVPAPLLPTDGELKVPADAARVTDVVLTENGPRGSIPFRRRGNDYQYVQMTFRSGSPNVLLRVDETSSVHSALEWPFAGTCGSGAVTMPARWERFAVEPNGDATLTTVDGAFAGCDLRTLRTSTLAGKPILELDGQPVAWAARHEGGLTILLPWGAEVATDAGTTGTEAARGVLWRVELPVKKGAGASVAARLAQGGATQRTREHASNATPGAARRIEVDVVQTTSDPAPMVVATIE